MLEIQQLSITNGDKRLLSAINLAIKPGEVVTLMGPSGCGKSTLLNWIIGDLSAPFYANGSLRLNGVHIDRLPIEKRQIGVLFQNDLLFPNMSVGKNLTFSLPAGNGDKHQRRADMETLLSSVGLDGFFDRDPTSLSGGQRARVSLLRAILAEPKALLLDEPFSKLDAQLRHNFREFVFDYLKTLNIPTLLVTHDIEDAPRHSQILTIKEGHIHA
jgi:putative thiamine transport system ATP-binding protein